jgi:glycosyltransferase involved in cell wall biosynthesis
MSETLSVVVEGMVSTIIAVFNRPVLLREAVESVLGQAYRPIEVIVVDDGSTDETGAVADALTRDHPDGVRVIRQANSGPGLAREAGRRVARGEYLQYLDSDDVLLPGKFQLQVTGLRARQDCGVSYGRTRYVPGGDRPGSRTGEKIETMFPAFLRSRWWETSTPLYRRRVLDDAGPWTSLWHEEDWEYDCRVASQGIRLHYCSEFVSEHRAIDPARLSGDFHSTARKLRDRATAHRLIFGHAQKAGIGPEVPEMQHFARELFLLTRQCGAAGLTQDAESLFKLARTAAGPERGDGWDFRWYDLLAKLLGWEWIGRIACFSDRLRPGNRLVSRTG